MKIIVVLNLLFLPTFLNAQELSTHIKDQLENIAATTGLENIPNDGYLNDQAYYLKHPLNLNVITPEQLRKIHVLNELQIFNFINYRKLMGVLINIYELQAIPGWDIISINKILPYITIESPIVEKFNWKKLLEGEQEIAVSWSRILEKSRGYDTSIANHFLGSPDQLSVQYIYRVKDMFQIGISGNKDAGEQFFKGKNMYGFDFYSVHFFIKQSGILKTLAIGNFTVNMGQGLIRWQSFSNGKGSETEHVVKESSVIEPSHSVSEFNFSRGIAITLHKNNWESTSYFSFRNLSAHMINDSTDVFTSLINSAYHRTAKEISGKGQVSLLSEGGCLRYVKEQFKLGININADHFSKPFQKQNKPYNMFLFSGTDLLNFSTDYQYVLKNIVFFGEEAMDKNSSKAFVNGALVSINKNVDFSFLYRNIDMKFQSLFNNFFSSTGIPQNESGIYTSVHLKFNSNLDVHAYMDRYHYPWLRYRINAPADGVDYKLKISYQLSISSTLQFIYRNQNKPLNNDSILPIYSPDEHKSNSIVLECTHKIKNGFIIKGRFEKLKYIAAYPENGFLFFISGNVSKKNLQSELRLQYFNTDSYNSRIYSMNSVTLSSFHIPSFYGKGFFYNIHILYKYRNFTYSFLWNQSIYMNQQSIGTGVDAINGHVKSLISIEGSLSI